MRRPLTDEDLDRVAEIDLGEMEDITGDDLGEGMEYAEAEENLDEDAFEAMTKGLWG